MEMGPLISVRHRLTGHTGRPPARTRQKWTVMWWWPYAVGDRRPCAAPQVALIRCCSPSTNRSRLLLSARSAIALLCRVPRSAWRGRRQCAGPPRPSARAAALGAAIVAARVDFVLEPLPRRLDHRSHVVFEPTVPWGSFPEAPSYRNPFSTAGFTWSPHRSLAQTSAPSTTAQATAICSPSVASVAVDSPSEPPSDPSFTSNQSAATPLCSSRQPPPTSSPGATGFDRSPSTAAMSRALLPTLCSHRGPLAQLGLGPASFGTWWIGRFILFQEISV
jgi:hypothetical protein